MKITKEENGNIRISGLNLLGKFKDRKKVLKSKKGAIKEKLTSEASKYRITREDNKLRIKKEKANEVEVEAPVETSVSEEAKPVDNKPRKVTEEEKEAIYNNDIARATNNGFFTPTIRDGYVTYWEVTNGNLLKRFGKYEDIKDKPNVAIRKSDVREAELLELGKSLEEQIRLLDNANTEGPEYISDIENAKRNNDNEVPSMREGYITYYQIVDDNLIKRFGKYDEVISKDDCYIKYRDRNYYKRMHRKMKNYNASEFERQTNVNLEQYNNDLRAIYEKLKYYPTPREGYVTYYKDGVKRFGKYEDIPNDGLVIIDDEDRENAEDYYDLVHQIAVLEASTMADDQDLEEKIVEETGKLLHEEDKKERTIITLKDDDVEIIEDGNVTKKGSKATKEDTNQFIEDTNHQYDEIIGSNKDDDLDLEEKIIEQTERELEERDNQTNNTTRTVRDAYGRLEDLNLSDEEKTYFESLANEYIGYLENPTEFKFEKEYKVRSKY